MSEVEINNILKQILAAETDSLDTPSEDDWRQLEMKFGCSFCEDFKAFVKLMSYYQFPGDILNVSSSKTNGNDSIALVYDYESEDTHWNPEMIPFYAIGNGDYFCINRTQCPDSNVYYYYSERCSFELYAPSMEAWIRQLPDFLS